MLDKTFLKYYFYFDKYIKILGEVKLNTDVERKIEEVIDYKMGSNEMFTAYDVSLDIQRKYGIRERHNNMKNYIHDVMTDHLDNYLPYRKTLITINGKGQAFLYFPMHEDPTTYSPVVTAPSFTNVSAVSCPSNATITASKNKQKNVTANSRNRLIIQKSYLEDVGLSSKDIAVVYADNNQDRIVIASKSVSPSADWDMLNKYIVDKSGNIMVSENILKKYDITTGDSYFLNVDGNVVSLTVDS